MSTTEDYLQNPTWVHHFQELFLTMDTNKNGYVSVEDWELWADNLEKEVKPAPELIAALRARLQELCAALGVVRGMQVSKDQYIKLQAKYAATEGPKVKRGEETALHRLVYALHDVVDTNRDGSVTLDEWKTVLKACNVDASAADETFKLLDKNRNGKIERHEFSDAMYKFWYALDFPEGKTIFGAKFENK